jgi:hypothetical protein
MSWCQSSGKTPRHLRESQLAVVERGMRRSGAMSSCLARFGFQANRSSIWGIDARGQFIGSVSMGATLPVFPD